MACTGDRGSAWPGEVSEAWASSGKEMACTGVVGRHGCRVAGGSLCGREVKQVCRLSERRQSQSPLGQATELDRACCSEIQARSLRVWATSGLWVMEASGVKVLGKFGGF